MKLPVITTSNFKLPSLVELLMAVAEELRIQFSECKLEFKCVQRVRGQMVTTI
jgi:hypothetical protein